MSHLTTTSLSWNCHKTQQFEYGEGSQLPNQSERKKISPASFSRVMQTSIGCPRIQEAAAVGTARLMEMSRLLVQGRGMNEPPGVGARATTMDATGRQKVAG